MRARFALLASLVAVRCTPPPYATRPAPEAGVARPADDPRDHIVTGSATAVDPGIPGHPPMEPLVRVDDPSGAAHVGRAPRRIDLAQFRASLQERLGALWTGPRLVRTDLAPGGTRFEPQADLLAAFAETMGRPDYVVSTSEVIDPNVAFAKLSGDAVRSACAAAVRRDAAEAPAARRVLVGVDATQGLPAHEGAIRASIAGLMLRLWGAQVTPDSGAVTETLEVFRVATARADATPLDGWRAVCIDLCLDPQFMSY